jgi:hypothetical protein
MLLRNRFLGGVSPRALFAPDMEGGTPEAPPAITPAVTVEGPTNARAAATLLSDWREKQAKAAKEPPAEQDKPQRVRATDGRFTSADGSHSSQGSTPTGEDAAPPQEANGETQEIDPAEQPPIELPKSWAKDKAEQWARLDRETQEYLANYDKTTSTEVRKAQNEAAEVRKSIETKEQAAEQARQRYEQAAQQTLQVLQQQQAAEFADIRTHADVQKLATDDPFRFAQWQARQMQIQAHAQEVEGLNRQREQEAKTKFDTWSKEQDAQFSKLYPEFDDPDKGQKAREGVKAYLKTVGVPEDTLPKLWNEPFFRDAMFQRVVYDASRFHAAQEKAKNAVQAEKPPVQRPGSPATKGQSYQAEIEAAQARLKNATGIAAIRAATELQAARRKAAVRR